MSSLLQTKSSFYYGYVISNQNYQIDFDEGATEFTAQLNIGSYTLTDFISEIERAFNSIIGITETYTVSVDRSTRIITINSTGTLNLLVTTGSHFSVSTYPLMGFTGADRTGSSSYFGNNASGSEYRPQFLLQSYVDPTIFKDPVNSSVNRSANGEVLEIITFGRVGFVEFNIRFATDIDQGKGGPIETNVNGVSDLIDFMEAITTAQTIEFMKDRDTPSTFFKILLEKTPQSADGVGFKLKELSNVPAYFETGILKFRNLT